MAAVGSDDEAILPGDHAAVDARLVTAGAPADLLEKYRAPWLIVFEAKAPELTRLEYVADSGDKREGIFLHPGKTDLHTYGYFLKLGYKAGNLFARCRIAGCSAGELRLTFDSKVKMKNFADHILGNSCGPYKLVTLKHWLAKKGGVRAEDEIVEGGAGGGAGAGAKRPAGEARRYKSDAIENAARYLVMDTLPWTAVERPGFRYLSDQFGIPTMTRNAVKDAFLRLYDAEVVAPRDAVIARMTKPQPFSAVGVDFVMQPWLSALGDGWDGDGRHFMSLTATGAQVVGGGGKFALELRPLPAVLALTHFLAANYGAVNMAALFSGVLSDMGIRAELVFAWVMDTTSTNPAMLRCAPWVHALFIGCAQHKIDLVAEDLLKNPVFVDVNNSVNFFTVFFYASEKRMQALLNMQYGVTARQLQPIKASETRFLQRAYQVERVVKLWPSLTKLYNELIVPAQGIFDQDTKKLFVDGYLRAASLHDEIKSFDTMAAPFLRYNARMGSEKDYTSGLQAPLFVTLFTHVDAERARAATLAGASGAKIVSMAETLITSLFTRLAPVRLFESAVRPAYVPAALPVLRRAEQLKLDDVFNAAALLDPACWATFEAYAGSYDDARTFIYNALKGQSKRVSAAVVPAVAAANKKALDVEIAAIRAMPKKSIWVSDDAHTKTLADLEAAARARYRLKDDAVEQAVAHDEHGPILAQLQIEVDALKKLVKAEGGRHERNEASEYGGPFDSDNEKRYSFWPKAKDTMPLLFLAAWLILASVPAASNKNERLHSVAGRICCKFRSAMKAASVEQQTLGYYYINDLVKRKMTEYAARLRVTNADSIDLAELDAILADELPPPLDTGDAVRTLTPSLLGDALPALLFSDSFGAVVIELNLPPSPSLPTQPAGRVSPSR
jgi:hypothetical protein